MEERNDQEKENGLNTRFPDLTKMNLLIQEFARMQQRLVEYIAPVIQRVNEIQQSYQPIIEQINRLTTSIDWDNLRESIKNKLQHYDEFMGEYDKECWAFSPELLDAIEDGEYDVTQIEKYVEDHLTDYIIFFQEDPLYCKHKSLIEEAFELFKQKYYKHCAFSLLAIFENILNTSFSAYQLETDLKIKNRKPKLYDKTKDFINSNEEKLALNILFFRRVFNVYNIIFDPSRGKHPDQINRNWIAHGNYDYDRISKSDILKLFQLLKASSILNEITFESIAS